MYAKRGSAVSVADYSVPEAATGKGVTIFVVVYCCRPTPASIAETVESTIDPFSVAPTFFSLLYMSGVLLLQKRSRRLTSRVLSSGRGGTVSTVTHPAHTWLALDRPKQKKLHIAYRERAMFIALASNECTIQWLARNT